MTARADRIYRELTERSQGRHAGFHDAPLGVYTRRKTDAQRRRQRVGHRRRLVELARRKTVTT